MASSDFTGRIAYCSLNGTTGAIIEQSGDFASSARASAGTYTLTYAAGLGIDPQECAILISSRTGGLLPYVRTASDTALGVKAVDTADAATDCDLDVVIICKPAI